MFSNLDLLTLLSSAIAVLNEEPGMSVNSELRLGVDQACPPVQPALSFDQGARQLGVNVSQF